eukprot:CAMPEP_0171096376 /NCGR_PEP_ID=MMETSP0766_2-20121228/44503_1 /TAXON_ID=439317 /ORGANISM="Gambierdiscus australes, Strain CAWD 149" /LENGTH=49 /DNA_ID= /DNA_START= /DNA_END= /DNA_ORIENTATION=
MAQEDKQGGRRLISPQCCGSSGCAAYQPKARALSAGGWCSCGSRMTQRR